MKNRVFLGLLLVAAGTATANADYTVSFGNPLFSGSQFASQTPVLSGTLTGFTYSVDFEADATAQSNGSWASDAAVTIMAPASLDYQWGGYDVLFGTNFVNFWSFDGPVSAPLGVYTDTRSDVDPSLNGAGTWTIKFGNGWGGSSPVQYNNVSVTLRGVDVVPAPSAAGLLGLAGLTIARRRRR